VLGAGNAALWSGVAGVEVGPMRCNVEAAGFGGDQGVFVVFCGGQCAYCVELGEVIFEHAFNIWVGTDIPRTIGMPQSNGQHLADLDDTCAHDIVILSYVEYKRLDRSESSWSASSMTMSFGSATANPTWNSNFLPFKTFLSGGPLRPIRESKTWSASLLAD
jgi:hypothetical protein